MKNYKSRKLLALLLAMAMIVTSMGLMAFADDEPVVDTNGNDVSYDEDQNISDDLDNEEEQLEPETEEQAEESVQPQAETASQDNASLLAAAVKPDKPALNAIKFSGKTAIISWKVTSGVSYKVTVNGSAQSNVDNSKGTCTVNIEPAKTYKYQVVAYNDGGESDPAEGSFTTVGAPTITSIEVPKQGIANGDGQRKKYLTADNLITINWTKASGSVKSYSVYRVEDGKLALVKSGLSASTTKYKFRAKAGTYSYVVRAISSQNADNYADSASKSAGKILDYLIKVRSSWHWDAKMDYSTKLYKNKTGSATVKKLAKGAKGRIIATYPKRPKKWNKPKRVQIQLYDSNGNLTNTKGWVKYSAISASAKTDLKRDYAASVKEAYVKNYSSSTGYLIWVNGYTQRINIFKGKKGNWKLVSSNRVTMGNFYQSVSRGTKTLGVKKGKVYMLDDRGRSYYFLYSRTFHGTGYFHTRSYWANGKAKNKVQDRPNTKGCVRQYTDDAKFLYSLPKGTKILFK